MKIQTISNKKLSPTEVIQQLHFCPLAASKTEPSQYGIGQVDHRLAGFFQHFMKLF